MTTFDSNPSTTQFLFWKLGKALSKRQAKQANNRARTLFQTTIRLVLHLAGLGFLTFAGFTASITVGLIVAGISCFILSWLNTTANRPKSTEGSNR